MALRFCPNLSYMFQETECLLERYDLARAAGFRAVECGFPYDYPPEDVAEAKNKAGLEQVLINAYPGDSSQGDRGLAAIPGKEEDFKTSIIDTIEYAEVLDCKMVHILAGLVDKETEEHRNVYIQNLKTAAEMLSKKNMIGLIEPINQYSVPNYFMNSFDKAISILNEINSPSLKLQLDVFHLQQICGDLTRNIEKFLPHVGHIQIAQVPNRGGPFTPGEINYDYVFYLLRKNYYTGWIGLEYTSVSKTTDSLNWISNF